MVPDIIRVSWNRGELGQGTGAGNWGRELGQVTNYGCCIFHNFNNVPANKDTPPIEGDNIYVWRIFLVSTNYWL